MPLLIHKQDGLEKVGNIFKKTIGILGSGGFAKELGLYIECEYKHSIYYIDKHTTNDNLLRDIYIIGSGKPQLKKIMALEIPNRPIVSYCHNSAVIYGSFGCGTVIAPMAVLAPHTRLGVHVLVNYSATIGHNSEIGNFSTVSPNASVGGFCKIGNMSYIGSNASIREGLTIGDNAIIGMSAVVTKDVPASSVAVGNPAIIMSIEEWNKRKQR